MSFGPTVPGETPIDPSGLKNRAITTRTQLNLAEAKNIRRALVKYLSRRPTARVAPFTFAWTLKLHQEMFGQVWTWAGRIRTHDLNLGTPFYNIANELQLLLDDLTHWTAYKMPLVEQGVRLHHRAVKIHPFENGNGRWARLLANIWLKRHRAPIVKWPEELVGDTSTIRGEYLLAIQAADQGDYDSLIALHDQYAQ